MPKTPSTAVNAYANGADLTARYDWRPLGDMAQDTGTRPANQAAFEALATVTTALKDASGIVESHALRGGRYEYLDLEALTGVGQSLLKKLVCGLAVWLLTDRRTLQTGKPPVPMPEWCKDMLAELADGLIIFPFIETQEAGVMHPIEMQPLGSEFEANRVVGEASRFFGDRSRNR